MNINRHDGVLFFEVSNSNPNGDPDSDNAPRQLSNQKGIVTDVCIKRKIRNYVEDVKKGEKGYEIAIKAGNDFDEITSAQTLEELTSTYFDFRTFGVVIPKGAKSDKKSKKKATDKNSPDHIVGPVQFSIAESIDKIELAQMTITRMSASGQDQTMGKKNIVKYGLYKCEFSINPFRAEKTGLSDKDLDVIFEALVNCWDLDNSSARVIRFRSLVVFEHEDPLGCLSSKLLNLVKVTKNTSEQPTKSEDYTIEVDRNNVPDGIKIRMEKHC